MAVATEHGAHRMPPGPRLPGVVQGLVALADRRRRLRILRERYGPTFTVQLPIFGRTVVVSDPADVRAIFRSGPDVVDVIDKNLGRVLGPDSMFNQTGDRHRDQRRLLTPPLHGRRLEAYERIVAEETRRELATLPQGRAVAVQPSMMRITLDVILRAVFGADGPDQDELRRLIPPMVELGSLLSLVPVPDRGFAGHGPWDRLRRGRDRYDALVDRLADRAAAAPEGRDDILTMMLQSRYDDGSPMTRSEIGDQLLTLLVAGHETTATTLAWAVERLVRHPEVLRRLVAEVDAGETGYLDAVLTEVQRSRPVIDLTFRKVVAETLELSGGWRIPRGQTLLVGLGMVHDDPAVHPDPQRFDPQRFLDARPDPATWVPFGGGVRRCVGAAFAQMEMRVALATLLREYAPAPTTAAGERWHSRGVAFAPARGGRVVLTAR